MTEPLVCAIMLTRDRPAMAARAVTAFRAQTYANKRLVIWDTSRVPFALSLDLPENEWCVEDVPEFSIGVLRNRAADWRKAREADVLIHMDDDDLSHPNRIAEQVALLQASGADCVGYNKVLFWKQLPTHIGDKVNVHWEGNTPQIGEAWLYRCPKMSPAIGSSLCYWRRTWEQRPFADLPKPGNVTSEYYEWLRNVKVVACSSLREQPSQSKDYEPRSIEPRLICSIHGGNSSGQYDNIEVSDSWRRVPEFDNYCREKMSL